MKRSGPGPCSPRPGAKDFTGMDVRWVPAADRPLLASTCVHPSLLTSGGHLDVAAQMHARVLAAVRVLLLRLGVLRGLGFAGGLLLGGFGGGLRFLVGPLLG